MQFQSPKDDNLIGRNKNTARDWNRSFGRGGKEQTGKGKVKKVKDSKTATDTPVENTELKELDIEMTDWSQYEGFSDYEKEVEDVALMAPIIKKPVAKCPATEPAVQPQRLS